jgi:hypothetical protein
VILSTALSKTCNRRFLSLITCPAADNGFVPPFQQFGQRHQVGNGWRPVKDGGNVRRQVFNG